MSDKHNDSEYPRQGCECEFCRLKRQYNTPPKNKNDAAWDLMQQANKDMDEDVQL